MKKSYYDLKKEIEDLEQLKENYYNKWRTLQDDLKIMETKYKSLEGGKNISSAIRDIVDELETVKVGIWLFGLTWLIFQFL